jgi:hypothetical protein
MAANNLLYLAGEGLITDARIIPCLLTGIKARPYRNSVISNSSLKTLALMTRRMPGAYAWSSDFDNKADTRKRKEIVAWWEDWWERNRDKHPVYDPEVDSIIWSAFLSVQDAIEEKVKPAHPELSLFHAQKNIRRLRPAMPLTQIYEYQYEPDMHSIPILYGATNGAIHAVGFNDLPWLEVACRFEDPEFPNRYEELRTKDRKPPERLTSMLTSVYSNHIAGTAIYLEVRVASPNKDLVRDLQTALQGLELSP